jgi:hypothetical protein
MFQEILRLIAELAASAATSASLRRSTIMHSQTLGGPRPNARENGQIRPSNTTRTAWNAGTHPPIAYRLPASSENVYYSGVWGQIFGTPTGANRTRPGCARILWDLSSRLAFLKSRRLGQAGTASVDRRGTPKIGDNHRGTFTVCPQSSPQG